MKATAWRTWAQDCLYQKAYTIPLQINLTAWVWPQCQFNSCKLLYNKSQYEVKSSQRQNWMAVSNTMVQTNVVTSKHEDCNLVFTNHGKEYGLYPPRKENILQRNNKSTKQWSIIKDLYKIHVKTSTGFTFSTYWRHNSAISKIKLNHLSISTGQGNQLVPLLTSAP